MAEVVPNSDAGPDLEALRAAADVLLVEDVRRIMRIGENQAYALVRSGQFYSVRVGRSIRIPKPGFQRWLLGEQP